MIPTKPNEGFMFATESMTAGKTITETYAKRAMRERHKAGYTAEIKDVVNGYGVFQYQILVRGSKVNRIISNTERAKFTK